MNWRGYPPNTVFKTLLKLPPPQWQSGKMPGFSRMIGLQARQIHVIGIGMVQKTSCIYIYIYNTHSNMHIYIIIYIYLQREREVTNKWTTSYHHDHHDHHHHHHQTSSSKCDFSIESNKHKFWRETILERNYATTR